MECFTVFLLPEYVINREILNVVDHLLQIKP